MNLLDPGAPELVLASGSSIRKKILSDAGIPFLSHPPAGEEPRPAPGERAADYVIRAATVKAIEVSRVHPGRLVAGCDQVVEYRHAILTKVTNREEAAARLRSLAGGVHHLVNGLVLARGGQVLAEHRESVAVTLRPLTIDVIERYLQVEAPLSSVACYFLEGRGIQLVERIDGSFHSALGLPLLPLITLLAMIK